jgi:DNA-binding LacI/PurR family transcriptional regulator
MTIVEFSRHIGLSTATVSRAFSGRGRISAKTRAYVQARAVEVGYRPNLQARHMVRRQTETIGLFYEAPEKLDSDYYVGEVAFGISDAAREHGQYLQIMTVPPNAVSTPAMMLDLVLSRSLDGFIVNLLQPWTAALLDGARQRGVPCVIIDNTRPPDDVTLSIGEGIETASRRIGEYLVGIGRCHVGLVCGIHDERKVAGFRHGLGDLVASLAVHPGGKTFQAGYDAALALLAGQPALDALFCANDVLAIGAMRALADQGRRVPADVAVVGCDDLAMARFTQPALTTLRLPKYELGHWAVRKLLALIRKHATGPAPALECSLILRESG